jgi:hypothetical protein
MATYGAAGAGTGQTVTYEKDIKGIIAAKCLSCHGSDAPSMEEFNKDKEEFKKKMKGPKMDTYQSLVVMVNGTDTGALMRRLDDGKNTKDGKPGNMHQYLGATDEERAANLSVIKAWVGHWTLKRAKELTEDEMKKITVPEK